VKRREQTKASLSQRVEMRPEVVEPLRLTRGWTRQREVPGLCQQVINAAAVGMGVVCHASEGG